MILYKYYSYEAGLKAMDSQQLGFRDTREFNDPFELSGIKAPSTFKEQVQESVVILSLTKSPLNPLMWSHYADEHRGFVIGYDTSVDFLTSTEHNLIPVQDGEVDYDKVITTIGLSKEEQDRLRGAQLLAQGVEESQIRDHGYDPEDARTILREMLLSKHNEWRYEKEVRVVKVPNPILSACGDWQSSHDYRSYNIPGESFTHGFSEVSIPGLMLFTQKVPIVEVYLGLRNPLLDKSRKRLPEDKNLAARVNNKSCKAFQVKMGAGSWDLLSHSIEPNTIMVGDNRRFVTSFDFSGHEALFLTQHLPAHLDFPEDHYQLFTVDGQMQLKKNNDFLEPMIEMDKVNFK